MISTMSSVIFGLLLVTITIVVQSAPVKIISSPKKVSHKSVHPMNPSLISSNSIITSRLTSKINDVKRKRNIDEYEQFNDESNEDDEKKIDNKLHTKIKETSAQSHDNVVEPIDTDNSEIFSDMKMNPNELIKLARKRRNIHLNDQINQRHKRALSTYDLYNTDPFYESLIEQQQFVRPTRAFAPIYWYPPVYKRNIRSSLASALYEPSEWNRVYADTIENNDFDEDQAPFFINDDDNDENDYEYNRYPILFDGSNIPYDNLQLQQEYNTDDLPIDEDYDQDEEFFSTRYGPLEGHFK